MLAMGLVEILAGLVEILEEDHEVASTNVTS
jgi:hypothetical protein